MIKVEGLNKTFKVHKKEPGLAGSAKALFKRNYIVKNALEDINLNLDEGEIIGLLGANGAGKTTLIKILSGIIHSSSGNVNIMGHNPWDRHNDYRKSMSVIMGQKAQLWWDLPPMDGFLLLKEIYQIHHKDFYESIEHLSEILNVKEQLNIQVRKLSLGERMKVELIAALLHKPKIIFLDEPTIGLDISAQKTVRKFIKEYRKEYNPTMILTSHYMDDIEELCPRIAILRAGQKVFDGDLSNLHNQYAKNKLLKAHVKNEEDLQKLSTQFPSELGTIELAKNEISISSPRAKVMDAARYLLNNADIIDLNIKEEEISNIVEKIMMKSGDKVE